MTYPYSLAGPQVPAQNEQITPESSLSLLDVHAGEEDIIFQSQKRKVDQENRVYIVENSILDREILALFLFS